MIMRAVSEIMITLNSFSFKASGFDGDCQNWYRDAMLHEDVGVHQGDELMQEVRLRVEELRSHFLHDRLQLLCGVSWNAVPGLGFAPEHRHTHTSITHTSLFRTLTRCCSLDSPVQEVDGVAPVVLDVPAEGREAHAHV